MIVDFPTRSPDMVNRMYLIAGHKENIGNNPYLGLPMTDLCDMHVHMVNAFVSVLVKQDGDMDTDLKAMFENEIYHIDNAMSCHAMDFLNDYGSYEGWLKELKSAQNPLAKLHKD